MSFRFAQLGVCRTTLSENHCPGIDVHARKTQVAVRNEEGEVIKVVYVANTDVKGIAQVFTGSKTALGEDTATSQSRTPSPNTLI